jgi:hypothetical protein
LAFRIFGVSLMKFRAAAIGACLASSLIFSPAFAVSPLPAGKPAGVKQAQLSDTIVPLALGAAVIAGIVIASSQQGQVATPIATTTGTSP